MYFFGFTWVLLFAAPIIHIFLDRHPEKRTRGRVFELFLLWQLGIGGALSIFAGIGHVAPGHEEIADQIGFAQSPFQWEVGFADMGLGVLLLWASWKRGAVIAPAIAVYTIMYGGDAIGHVIEWVQHDNTEPYNIWSIPSDALAPLFLWVFYFLVRRERPEALETREHERRQRVTRTA